MATLSNPFVKSLLVDGGEVCMPVADRLLYSLRRVERRESDHLCLIRASVYGAIVSDGGQAATPPAAYYIKTVMLRNDIGPEAPEAARAAREMRIETSNHRRFQSERAGDAAPLLEDDHAVVKAVRDMLDIGERWPVQVTQEPGGYVTLNSMFRSETRPSARERRRVAVDLMRFLDGVTSVGSHCDMHPRNILVRKKRQRDNEGEGENEAYHGAVYRFKLIDFDRFLWKDGGKARHVISSTYQHFVIPFIVFGLEVPDKREYARSLDVSMAFHHLHGEAARLMGVDHRVLNHIRSLFLKLAPSMLPMMTGEAAECAMRMWGHAWASLWLKAHGRDANRAIERIERVDRGKKRRLAD